MGKENTTDAKCEPAVASTAWLATQIIDAVSIAANLSKDMRSGESAVAWVKRVIAEREYAKTTIALIDRECSLCAPIATVADRVQRLIHRREANNREGVES